MTPQGESTEQFVTRLRKLASTCEYGDQTNDQIRDQVIATCFSSSHRKKFLTETSITLEKLLEIAQAMESAHHQSKEIESGSSKSTLSSETGQDEEYLNYLRWKQRQQPPVKRKIEKHSKKSCGRCGASGHISNECRRSKDVKCNKFHKKGHFAKMCHSKTSSTSSIPSAKSRGKHITSQLAHQEISSESEGEGDNSDVYIFRISSPF